MSSPSRIFILLYYESHTANTNQTHNCGECSFCKEGLTSMCDRTNSSALQEKLYGRPFAGLFDYSHFTGGYAGGQAEYVRAPFADVNLLKIPDSVPDEKALYLSDIIPTSYHATVCAVVKEGKSVCHLGSWPHRLVIMPMEQARGSETRDSHRLRTRASRSCQRQVGVRYHRLLRAKGCRPGDLRSRT